MTTAADVLRELRAQFKRRGDSPDAAPDVAMTVIGPLLRERDEAIEWRDREIARLRGLLGGKSSDESSWAAMSTMDAVYGV